jgi:hypothetical protein
MSKQTAHLAKTALTLALLLAIGPSHDLSPSPLSGIRTALELITKQPGRSPEPAGLH